jgi:hypothetical protein
MGALLFDVNDIINLAITNLMAHPLQQNAHGSYCVRCALADAKGELDKQHEVSFDFGGMTVYDLELLTAVDRVADFTAVDDKDQAIAALEAALHR